MDGRIPWKQALLAPKLAFSRSPLVPKSTLSTWVLECSSLCLSWLPSFTRLPSDRVRRLERPWSCHHIALPIVENNFPWMWKTMNTYICVLRLGLAHIAWHQHPQRLHSTQPILSFSELWSQSTWGYSRLLIAQRSSLTFDTSGHILFLIYWYFVWNPLYSLQWIFLYLQLPAVRYSMVDSKFVTTNCYKQGSYGLFTPGLS